jgi:D-amino-acid dehydrogenase
VRITTGAEFAHRDAPSTPWQLTRAEAAARELIDLPTPVEAQPWRGARPCLPDMKPVIGPAPKHRGLWFNFGHGHQGFTMGPISGRLLAEMVDGDTPRVDPRPYSPARFG